MTMYFLQIAEKKFVLIFLLVNDHRGDVLVTTNVSGQLDVNYIKPMKTVAISKTWKTKTSVTVSAIDATTNQTVNINEQSVVYLEPTTEEFLSLKVLNIKGRKYTG